MRRSRSSVGFLALLCTLLTILLHASNALSVELTAQEQAFLRDHPVVRLGSDATWEPFVVVDDDGGIRGYDADLIARINSLTGADIRLVAGSWPDVQERVKRGELDGLSTSTAQAERSAYLAFSEVYLSLRYLVLVPKGNPGHLQRREDLEGRAVATRRGNLAEAALARTFKHLTIVELETGDEVIEAVATGRVDAAFDSGSALLYRASRTGSPYLQTAFVLDESLNLVFSVRRDWPELVGIIDKGLQAITEEERKRLQAKWFLEPLEQPGASIAAQLTLEESAFLDRSEQLRVCADPDWMPIEGVGETGEYQGIMADVMRVLAQRLERDLQRIPTNGWADSVAALKDGRCDVLSSAVITPSRKRSLEFTTPLISEPLVVVTRQDVTLKEDIDAYAKETVVMIRGHAAVELMRREHPAMTIVEVPDIETGLRAVESEDAFAYIDVLPPVVYAAQRYGILNIKVAANLPEYYDIALATRPGEPLLRSSLAKAISSIGSDEIRQIRERWTSVSLERGPDYARIWPYAFGGALVLVGVVLWNRRLAQVNASLAAANERIASLTITDPLTEIFNRRHFNEIVPLEWRRAVRDGTAFNLMLIDVDHFKEYNDLYGHQAGDEALIRVADLLRRHSRRSGDYAFRIGGEEFVLLIRSQDGDASRTLAEGLRRECEQLGIVHHGSSAGSVLTISIGLLCARPQVCDEQKAAIAGDWEYVYQAADALLYDAKDAGRNQVVSRDSGLED